MASPRLARPRRRSPSVKLASRSLSARKKSESGQRATRRSGGGRIRGQSLLIDRSHVGGFPVGHQFSVVPILSKPPSVSCLFFWGEPLPFALDVRAAPSRALRAWPVPRAPPCPGPGTRFPSQAPGGHQRGDQRGEGDPGAEGPKRGAPARVLPGARRRTRGSGGQGGPKKRGAEAGGLVKRRRRADFWYLASLVVFHLEGTPETFGLVERGSRLENHMPRCTSQAFRVESSCSGASDCQRWRDHRPGYFLTGPLWSSERLRLHPGLGVQGRGQAGKATWKLRKRRRVLFI